MQAADPETAAVRIVDLVKTRIPRRFGFDALREIQVLCPMNRGGAGARSLNIELQAALNPARERRVERFGWTFAPGDKVMQVVNDYGKDVYNGDTGQVADVNPDTGELTARFHGQEHVYGFGELDALTPAGYVPMQAARLESSARRPDGVAACQARRTRRRACPSREEKRPANQGDRRPSHAVWTLAISQGAV